MRHTKSIGTLALLAAIVLAGPALAHPKLESTIPAPDVSLSESPKEIRLTFSEAIIVKFSGVELKDEAGHQIPTGDPISDSKDLKQLAVPLSTTLSSGRYTVSWHAVSEDTHRVNGQYAFGIVVENSQVKSEGTRFHDPAVGAGRPKERGDGECRCGDHAERTDLSREPTRDSDRSSDQREAYRDRPRYDSRPPECIIDDEGYKYCRVR